MSPGASSRPRVLVVAEAANPQWASVPLVGWSHARALAQVADVHLVTQVRNRSAILGAGLVEGRDFTSIDSESIERPFHLISEKLRGGPGVGWTTVSALGSISYYHFEKLVWRHFRKRLRDGEFQIVHRLTPLSPVTPSLLSRHCRRLGIPFVLGPLNGGLPWPRGYGRVRRQEREWLSYLRGAYRLLPRQRAMLTESAAVIAGSRSTWSEIVGACRDRCVYIPENAIDPARFPPPRPREPRDRLEVVFLGRLVPYKGPDLLFDAAAALVRSGRVRISIIGDGPMRQELEAQVRSLGIQDGVRFLGWVDQAEVHRHLGDADVLGFPSIREFGGAVALEGMATGAVPIVVDYGGPAELVSDATGYRLPLGPRSELEVRLRNVLQSIADEPKQLILRREAGYRRVLHWFTWEAKARQVLEIYRWVLGERPDRPDFGMPFPDEGDTEVPKVPVATPLPGTARPGPDGGRANGAFRVAIVANNVSLRMSGETAVPYYYFTGFLKRGIEAWLVCHSRVRAELKETFPPDVFSRIRFIDDDIMFKSIWRTGLWFPYRVDDLVFGQSISALAMYRARALVRGLVAEHSVQVVFQPTPISPRGVSFLYDVGAPVVIGPMCGGLDLPPAFHYMESGFTRGAIRGVREISKLANRLIPGKLRADALLVGNQRTIAHLPASSRAKVYEVVESGVDLARWAPKDYSKKPAPGPVRFVFCGRFVDWKGAEFAIEGFARVAGSLDARLDLIGDGPLLRSLVDRVASLGLQGRVNFLGRLPIERCIDVMRDSDVYVAPSLRECGGLAILEAMGLGLPFIAADWLAPSEYLNRECAVLVDVSSREGFVDGIAEGMKRLAASPELRRAMGEAARRRVEAGLFGWDIKTDRVLEILDEVARTRDRAPRVLV